MSLHTFAHAGEMMPYGASHKRQKVGVTCPDGNKWSGDLYCSTCQEIVSVNLFGFPAGTVVRSREHAHRIAERHISQRLFSKHHMAWFCSCHALEAMPETDQN